MQLSMMIAEVGFMLNVSGSRIATPLAPPKPGSTPMMTPSTMPISISARLVGVSATWKPCRSDASSFIARPLRQMQQRFERTLRQRRPEPELEHQEQHDRHADRHRCDDPRTMPAVTCHEVGEKDHRGNVDPERRDRTALQHRSRKHLQYPAHLGPRTYGR